MIRTVIFHILLFGMIHCGDLFSQNGFSAGTVQDDRLRRRVIWKGVEHAYRYAVEIQRLEDGKYYSYLHYYTKTSNTEVLLPIGKYRFRVFTYDILDRHDEGSPWIDFNVMLNSKTENEDSANISFDIEEIHVLPQVIEQPAITELTEKEQQLIWVPVEMIKVSAGTFIRGSSDINEAVNLVTLTHDFWIGKYEITQEQYEYIMKINPSWYHGGDEREAASGEEQRKRPVENVTWFDAVEFCNKLSEKEGLASVYTITGRNPVNGYPIIFANVTANWNVNGYRLPTEAEWEYACRAGTATVYSTGDIITGNTGWYFDNSGNKTHQTGLKTPNDFGLFDMHGNVWEWCWDWHRVYSGRAETNPQGPASGTYRAARGGSWSNTGQNLRSALRGINYPDSRLNNIGFRVVCGSMN